MNPEEERRKLYDFLKEKNAVSESFDIWTQGNSDEKNLLRLYANLKQSGFITEEYAYGDFKSEQFGDVYKTVKKKESSPSETSLEVGSSNLDAKSQEITKQKSNQEVDPISENIKWLGGDPTRKDQLLVSDIPLAERKQNAKFSPGNLFPASLLEVERKTNEEYNQALEALDKLKNKEAFGDDERLYEKTVQERLAGFEQLLNDIDKDKSLYLKEKTNDATMNKWYGMFSVLDDRTDKIYSELYQQDEQKYKNYLDFGNFEGEEKKINNLEEKEKMYSSLSNDLSKLKSDKELLGSYRTELAQKEREKLDKWSLGLAKSFEIPYLPDNLVAKQFKENKLSELLDAQNFKTDAERAEFRDFVLTKIDSEDRTNQLQNEVKVLADKMGVKFPSETDNEEYKNKMSAINLDFQAQTKSVVDNMKTVASQSDTKYRSDRDKFIAQKRKEANELAATFDEPLKQAYSEYQAKSGQLQQLFQSGQLSKEQFDDQNKQLFSSVEQIQNARKEQLSKFNESSQAQLKDRYKLYLDERNDLLGNPTSALKKLELIKKQAEAKALELQSKYGVSDDDKKQLEELYAIANAKITAEQKIKRDLEWDKLSSKEKFGQSFQKGVLQLFQSMGVAAEYMAPGIDQVSFDITDVENKILSYAQKDFGKFEWSQLMDKDFIIANVGEQIPIMMPLAGTAGLATKGATMTLGKTALSARMKNALAATIGAISTRPIEGAMNAGSVFRQQLQEGSSFEEAYDKANQVFTYNQGLIVTDAIQNYLWFTKGGKVINTNPFATRIMKETGEKILGASAEGFEEVYQGGVEKMATDASYANLGVMSAVSKFAATEEGRKSFGTGILMGPIIDGYGFVTSGRSDVARLNKQFRDYMKMAEQISELGAPKELSELMSLRDLQLREVFGSLRANGDMSEKEFKEVTDKLNYQVEMMKRSVGGELPFAWNSDRFAAFSQFSYEAKQLRNDAENLPKSDKAGKDELKARAEKLEKNLKSLMENPRDSHTYSVDGTQVTEDEFRAILDSGNQDLIDMGSFKTSNVEIIKEYMDKGTWPKKETARSISNASDMVAKGMAMSDEGSKYKSEKEAIDGLVAEKEQRLSEIEKELNVPHLRTAPARSQPSLHLSRSRTAPGTTPAPRASLARSRALALVRASRHGAPVQSVGLCYTGLHHMGLGGPPDAATWQRRLHL